MPPNPHFKQISPNGKLTIRFDNEVFEVSDLKMLNNGTIIIGDYLAHGRILKRRTSIRTNRKPVLLVEVIPGSLEPGADLIFTWNVTHQTPGELLLHLYFADPHSVSAYQVSLSVLLISLDPRPTEGYFQ